MCEKRDAESVSDARANFPYEDFVRRWNSISMLYNKNIRWIVYFIVLVNKNKHHYYIKTVSSVNVFDWFITYFQNLNRV